MSNSSISEISRSRLSKQASNVTEIMTDVHRKSVLEKKAFDALDMKLSAKRVVCKRCKGDGCGVCEDEGWLMQEPDMRAIELVLKPKFPNTQVNINADLEDAEIGDLMKMIEGM